jgi:pyridoxal biosynthesis lyase PdxS
MFSHLDIAFGAGANGLGEAAHRIHHGASDLLVYVTTRFRRQS